MENQEKRDLTLREEIKKETRAYKALCEKKSSKYKSFAEMKSKLAEEIECYEKDERERVYECYKNYIEKTNTFVSSIIPMLAAFAIGIFPSALATETGNNISAHCVTKTCEVHSECLFIEYSQVANILPFIAFAVTLFALAGLMIGMVCDSARSTNEKRFYQMVIQIIESIEKDESESKNSTSTDEESVVS